MEFNKECPNIRGRKIHLRIVLDLFSVVKKDPSFFIAFAAAFMRSMKF